MIMSMLCWGKRFFSNLISVLELNKKESRNAKKTEKFRKTWMVTDLIFKGNKIKDFKKWHLQF